MKQKEIPAVKIPKKKLMFLKSLRLAKSGISKTFMMVLFDALFLASAYSITYLLFRLNSYFAKTIAVADTSSAIYVFFALSSFYYIVLVMALLLAYSFFKYSVLDCLKSLFGSAGFSFKRLGQFYLLNIMIAGIGFALVFALNLILAGIRQDYAPYIFVILAVPILLALYVITNFSHSLFYEGASASISIRKSLAIAFTKAGSYREIILAMALTALAWWLLFLGAGYLIQAAASSSYSLYLSMYAYFKQASIIVLDAAFYFIILINRISFYAIARESLQQHKSEE